MRNQTVSKCILASRISRTCDWRPFHRVLGLFRQSTIVIKHRDRLQIRPRPIVVVVINAVFGSRYWRPLRCGKNVKDTHARANVNRPNSRKRDKRFFFPRFDRKGSLKRIEEYIIFDFGTFGVAFVATISYPSTVFYKPFERSGRKSCRVTRLNKTCIEKPTST